MHKNGDVSMSVTLDCISITLAGTTLRFRDLPGAYDVINTETTKRDAFIAKVGALGAPPVPSYLHLDASISASSDDAEEYGSGTMDLISPDLDMV